VLATFDYGKKCVRLEHTERRAQSRALDAGGLGDRQVRGARDGIERSSNTDARAARRADTLERQRLHPQSGGADTLNPVARRLGRTRGGGGEFEGCMS
jgi:hypothetical protein